MNFEAARKLMVEEQLIPRGINDEKVLNAFLKVERYRFIPEELQASAYADYPLPIGEGQTISQPYIVALMTQALKLNGSEKVLEIGTGSGYQAAILSQLAKEVYSIERFPVLVKGAQGVLAGYNNIHTKIGDGTLGWPEEAPFDAIIITAASPKIPLPLTAQLKEEGRLILPLGDSFTQMLTLFKNKNGNLESADICPCVFVPLVGKYGYNKEI
ncbi:MAG: protein-L-isoaspartate(D-aspartate) O-methyltransferase [Candidatus Omnitrophica bacterium]|nr:protein-L-isoaspartate(D-aspartate) O-methyltransferase [Candidatus Omnitrophota bacterium]